METVAQLFRETGKTAMADKVVQILRKRGHEYALFPPPKK